MDIFQFILGLVLLIIGGMTTYKSRDTKKILLGILLIIIGLAFAFGGLGGRI